MKILLIHREDETETTGSFVSLLEKMNILFDVLLVKTPEVSYIKQFSGLFNPPDSKGNDERQTSAIRAESPTHVAIISPVSRSWFDFLAGFSFGSRMPVLVYGQEAITGISEDFAFCFTFIQNEASLRIYLDTENKAFKKQEEARQILKAQETLLRMGIPVTGESLASSAGTGSVQEVSLFLKAGFSPDTKDKTGVPILNISARKGNREVCDLLINAGAQVNSLAADRGSSALIDAVIGKHKDMVADLIKAGADPNIRSKDGQSALVIAVGSGDEGIVEALLKAGSDADIPDSLGVTARKYASLFRKAGIMALFETYAPVKTV